VGYNKQLNGGKTDLSLSYFHSQPAMTPSLTGFPIL
jgi:hypothetical protein